MSEVLEPAQAEISALHEELAFLRESVQARLDFEIQMSSWRRLDGEDGQEPSPQALATAREMMRFAWLKNPLIRRAVDLLASYVFGQGVNVRASDENLGAVLSAFMEERQNQAELFGEEVREQRDREIASDGEMFLVCFVNRHTGAVRLSSIPPAEIQEVITDPENRKRPWFYRRVWQQTSFSLASGPGALTQESAYYPHLDFSPQQQPQSIAGIAVRWDAPVLQVKVGGFSDWKRGFPEHEVSRAYATSYKDFIADWATITKSLARFAWKNTGAKSAAEVALIRARLGTTLSLGGGTEFDRNPAPLPGATAILGEGRDLIPLKTSGVAVGAQEGRQLRIMAITASGFGDHFYGDAQQGSLATAKSLDRPTELRVRGRQRFWTGVYRRLFGFVFLWAVRAPGGPLRQKATLVSVPGEPDELPRLEWHEGIDPTVNIDWPQIVAPDIGAYIKALVTGAAFLPRELVSQLMMTALEVDGVEQWIQDMQAQPAPSASAAAGLVPAAATAAKAGTNGGAAAATEAQFVEALTDLRHSLSHLSEYNSCHVPGGPEGGEFCSGDAAGGAGAEGLRLEKTEERVFTGAPVATKAKFTKEETGKLAEEIVQQYLRDQGFSEASALNMVRNNFPVDATYDHAVVEVKGGQVSNGKSAQQWRLTIGEPGKSEKEWLKAASKEEKRTHNLEKKAAIPKRKEAAMAELSAKLGFKVKSSTMTVIINPDHGTADLYRFEGFHHRIGWTSKQAKDGYLGTVKYSRGKGKGKP